MIGLKTFAWQDRAVPLSTSSSDNAMLFSISISPSPIKHLHTPHTPPWQENGISWPAANPASNIDSFFFIMNSKVSPFNIAVATLEPFLFFDACFLWTLFETKSS